MRQWLLGILPFGLGVIVGNIFSSNKTRRDATEFLAALSSGSSNATLNFLMSQVTRTGNASIEQKTPIANASTSSQTNQSGLHQPGCRMPECQETLRPTQLRLDGDFMKRDGKEVILDLPKLLKCDPLERLLVINLEGPGGELRRNHVYQQFEQVGLKGRFKFWPAVDFKTNERLANETGKHKCPCDSKMSCSLSHREIYEMMLYEKWPCATIFEDDVALARNFTERVAAVTDSIPPFDVIQWGFCPHGSKPREESKDQTIPKVKYGWPGACLHAYTVSLQGALVLTHGNTPVHTPADGAMDGMHHWRKDLRKYLDRSPGKYTGAYWYVEPMLAYQALDADNFGGGTL